MSSYLFWTWLGAGSVGKRSPWNNKYSRLKPETDKVTNKNPQATCQFFVLVLTNSFPKIRKCLFYLYGLDMYQHTFSFLLRKAVLKWTPIFCGHVHEKGSWLKWKWILIDWRVEDNLQNRYKLFLFFREFREVYPASQQDRRRLRDPEHHPAQRLEKRRQTVLKHKWHAGVQKPRHSRIPARCDICRQFGHICIQINIPRILHACWHGHTVIHFFIHVMSCSSKISST